MSALIRITLLLCVVFFVCNDIGVRGGRFGGGRSGGRSSGGGRSSSGSRSSGGGFFSWGRSSSRSSPSVSYPKQTPSIGWNVGSAGHTSGSSGRSNHDWSSGSNSFGSSSNPSRPIGWDLSGIGHSGGTGSNFGGHSNTYGTASNPSRPIGWDLSGSGHSTGGTGSNYGGHSNTYGAASNPSKPIGWDLSGSGHSTGGSNYGGHSNYGSSSNPSRPIGWDLSGHSSANKPSNNYGSPKLSSAGTESKPKTTAYGTKVESSYHDSNPKPPSYGWKVGQSESQQPKTNYNLGSGAKIPAATGSNTDYSKHKTYHYNQNHYHYYQSAPYRPSQYQYQSPYGGYGGIGGGYYGSGFSGSYYSTPHFYSPYGFVPNYYPVSVGGGYGNTFRDVLSGMLIWHMISDSTHSTRYHIYNYNYRPQPASIPEKLPSDALIICSANMSSICAPNTTALCTKKEVILCVANVTATVPCGQNTTASCVNSTIPCIDAKDPACRNTTTKNNSTTVSIPCLANITVTSKQPKLSFLDSDTLEMYERFNTNEEELYDVKKTVYCVTTLAEPDLKEKVVQTEKSCSETNGVEPCVPGVVPLAKAIGSITVDGGSPPQIVNIDTKATVNATKI